MGSLGGKVTCGMGLQMSKAVKFGVERAVQRSQRVTLGVVVRVLVVIIETVHLSYVDRN